LIDYQIGSIYSQAAYNNGRAGRSEAEGLVKFSELLSLVAATTKNGLSPPPTPAGGPVAEPEISSFGEGLPAPPLG